ncbi:odorant-binding protein 59a [Leptinotarsa decemlineata]|uniref:odorant-binding protein 59a n=1 Tax=Leptinotarsa decemlineata TaxID=7539 RepID=UPI003D30A0C0
MRSAVLLFISYFVSYSMALECGIAKKNQNEIKQALKICVKNNETLERIWEMTSESSSRNEPSKGEDSESESEEEELKSTTSTPKSGKNGKLARIKRAKSVLKNQQPISKKTGRDTDEKEKTDDSDLSKHDSKDGHDSHENEGNELSEGTTETSSDSSENCIIHCVLEQLNMIDDNGLPERTKLSEELLKSATGRELRNFLQETTDECFQEMNEETDMDSCSYSTKLVTCLAERGRANCADWPAGGLPF